MHNFIFISKIIPFIGFLAWGIHLAGFQKLLWTPSGRFWRWPRCSQRVPFSIRRHYTIKTASNLLENITGEFLGYENHINSIFSIYHPYKTFWSHILWISTLARSGMEAFQEDLLGYMWVMVIWFTCFSFYLDN